MKLVSRNHKYLNTLHIMMQIELTDGCRHTFSILTLNIESINAKFYELTIYIEELSKINFKFSVICLQLGYQMMLTYLFSKLLDMTAFHKENLAVKKGV